MVKSLYIELKVNLKVEVFVKCDEDFGLFNLFIYINFVFGSLFLILFILLGYCYLDLEWLNVMRVWIKIICGYDKIDLLNVN